MGIFKYLLTLCELKEDYNVSIQEILEDFKRQKLKKRASLGSVSTKAVTDNQLAADPEGHNLLNPVLNIFIRQVVSTCNSFLLYNITLP